MRLEQTENFNKQSESSRDDLNLLGLMGKDKFDKFDKSDKFDKFGKSDKYDHENEHDDPHGEEEGDEKGEPKDWMDDDEIGECGKGKGTDKYDEGGKIDKFKKEQLLDDGKIKKILKGSSGSSSDSGSLEFSSPYPAYSI